MILPIAIAYLNLVLGVLLALVSARAALRSRDAGWWMMAIGFLVAAICDIAMLYQRGRGDANNIALAQYLTPILALTIVPGMVMHSRSRTVCWGFWIISAVFVAMWAILHVSGLEPLTKMGRFSKPIWCLISLSAGLIMVIERSLLHVILRRDAAIIIAVGIAILSLSSLIPYVLLHQLHEQQSITLWTVRNAASAASSVVLILGFLQAR